MTTEPVCVSIMLSDYVLREHGTGKNSLIGCFNNFNAPQFPFVAPPFFITVALTNLPPQIKELNLTMRIEDQDTGFVLQSVGGQVKFGEPFVVTKEMVVELPFPSTPFVIQKPGHYVINVLVNNSFAGKRLLTVNAINAPTLPHQ